MASGTIKKYIPENAQVNWDGTYAAVAAGATATYEINVVKNGLIAVCLNGYGIYSGLDIQRCYLNVDRTKVVLTAKNTSNAAVTPYMVYAIVGYMPA